MKEMESKIFNIKTSKDFKEVALEVFRFQAHKVPIYKEYIGLLKVNVDKVDTTEKIPFLPIQFFKTHNLIVEGFEPKVTFTSSGTTGTETSRHLVANPEIYTQSFSKTFNQFYGQPSDYCILALLPSYLERQGSSLIYMVEELIKLSINPESGFYLNEFSVLAEKLESLEAKNNKIILLGVSFALLEFAEKYKFSLKNTTVMETGGMKGRRKEMTREELHSILCNRFGVNQIHSEYGMTELLSQAYSAGKGIFTCPPWMNVFIRDPYDPFTLLPEGRTGAINIIDLANLYSCSFIQTDDLGRKNIDGSFEILGRLEGSQLRGCNTLIYS